MHGVRRKKVGSVPGVLGMVVNLMKTFASLIRSPFEMQLLNAIPYEHT